MSTDLLCSGVSEHHHRCSVSAGLRVAAERLSAVIEGQPHMLPERAGPPEPLIYKPPGEPFLKVLHCDEDLLIISKPSGLLSVPGKSSELADCVEARAQQDYPGATMVHRLDLDTSGIMIVARNRSAHRHLSWQFERRQVGKVYIARVWGRVDADAGEVDAPLICDWPNRPRQMIDQVRGRTALTAWQVLGRDDDATRVRLLPKTGRSHQLRVHMLSIGHPILGDRFYAHDRARDVVGRLQLHAQSISFRHPTGGRAVAFEDPCPF